MGWRNKIGRYRSIHWKGIGTTIIIGGIILTPILIYYFSDINWAWLSFGSVIAILTLLSQRKSMIEFLRPHPKIIIIGNPIFSKAYIVNDKVYINPEIEGFIKFNFKNKHKYIGAEDLKLKWIMRVGDEFGAVIYEGDLVFDISPNDRIEPILELDRIHCIKCPLKETWIEGKIFQEDKLVGFFSKKINYTDNISKITYLCPMKKQRRLNVK